MQHMHKGVFLDRDGTLIEDVPYLADPAKVRLLPGAQTALEALVQAGFKLFLFTNQSGIGRGLMTLEDAKACNAALCKQLGDGIIFTDTCIAPERPDAPSTYRKPSPRFILEMCTQHTLDPRQTFMIGDRQSDMEAALNAQIHAIRVSTGEAMTALETEWKDTGKIRCFPDIQSAATFITAYTHADL